MLISVSYSLNVRKWNFKLPFVACLVTILWNCVWSPIHESRTVLFTAFMDSALYTLFIFGWLAKHESVSFAIHGYHFVYYSARLNFSASVLFYTCPLRNSSSYPKPVFCLRRRSCFSSILLNWLVLFLWLGNFRAKQSKASWIINSEEHNAAFACNACRYFELKCCALFQIIKYILAFPFSENLLARICACWNSSFVGNCCRMLQIFVIWKRWLLKRDASSATIETETLCRAQKWQSMTWMYSNSMESSLWKAGRAGAYGRTFAKAMGKNCM